MCLLTFTKCFQPLEKPFLSSSLSQVACVQKPLSLFEEVILFLFLSTFFREHFKKGPSTIDRALLPNVFSLTVPIDQEIEQAGAKHIGQSMHEEEWQEIFDHLLVENIVEESIDHSNDHRPK